MRTQPLRGRGGAGERNDVLLAEMLQEIGWVATQQLETAGWQELRRHDLFDQTGREVRRLPGRLDHGRHAGEERGSELLQRPPDREVEGVDLQGDAVSRGCDVLANERAAAAEWLEPSINQNRVVRKLSTTLAAVAEQHANAAVDVSFRVRPRRAGIGGDGIELGAPVQQVTAQLFEQHRPLVECQLTQRWPADPPTVV